MLVSDDTVSSNASSSLPPGVLARAITSSASCNPTRAAISAAEGGAKRSSIFLKNIALGRRKKEGTRDSLCKFNEMMRDIKRCCVCMVGENGISQQHVFEGWANHYAYLRFPLF